MKEVFEHWRETSGHARADLTSDRKTKIRARLKRFSVDDLKRAIDGACANPFYLGDNDRGQRYDFPETIFKSDSATEKHMAYAPPASGDGVNTNGALPDADALGFSDELAKLYGAKR